MPTKRRKTAAKLTDLDQAILALARFYKLAKAINRECKRAAALIDAGHMEDAKALAAQSLFRLGTRANLMMQE
jgi:hypothetical protein